MSARISEVEPVWMPVCQSRPLACFFSIPPREGWHSRLTLLTLIVASSCANSTRNSAQDETKMVGDVPVYSVSVLAA